jgi:hypothetical protein
MINGFSACKGARLFDGGRLAALRASSSLNWVEFRAMSSVYRKPALKGDSRLRDQPRTAFRASAVDI